MTTSSKLDDILGKLNQQAGGYEPGTTCVFVDVRLAVGEWDLLRREVKERVGMLESLERQARCNALTSDWRRSGLSAAKKRRLLANAFERSDEHDWRSERSIPDSDLDSWLAQLEVQLPSPALFGDGE